MTVKQGHAAAEGRRLRRRMKDGALVATGAVGGVLAAICCATPLLALVLETVGLGAWLAKADYVLIPALVLFLALFALGLYRRSVHHGPR
jgi:mercuric ion transport protein